MASLPRILFSARDPGAVDHVLQILGEVRRRGALEPLLAASGVALERLRQAGEHPLPFALGDGSSAIGSGDDPGPLLAAASALLDETRPDAVFTSLSTFGAGIDEALLATARVPTFQFQDFWGDINLSLGTAAGLYFVLDDYAARVTRERWGVPSQVVGSPKHFAYAGLDVEGLRRSVRATLGVGAADRVVGFFGQSPEIPGHEEAFESLLRALATLDPAPCLVLREHPKFVGLWERHRLLADSVGLRAVEADASRPVEAWLVGCDLAVTPYSLCGLDHLFLSARSDRPLGTMLYLMCNEPLKRYVAKAIGLPQLPIVTQGFGRAAESVEDLPATLAELLGDAARVAYHRASRAMPRLDAASVIASTLRERLQ